MHSYLSGCLAGLPSTEWRHHLSNLLPAVTIGMSIGEECPDASRTAEAFHAMRCDVVKFACEVATPAHSHSPEAPCRLASVRAGADHQLPLFLPSLFLHLANSSAWPYKGPQGRFICGRIASTILSCFFFLFLCPVLQPPF